MALAPVNETLEVLARSLTNGALADRLEKLATNNVAFTPAERYAFLAEAAARFNGVDR